MFYVSGPPVFPLLNKHEYTPSTHTQREMEQKETQVKAEQEHNNDSEREKAKNGIKQDRRMEKRNLNQNQK